MEVTGKGWRISFGGDKDILNVMVAQLCNLKKGLNYTLQTSGLYGT